MRKEIWFVLLLVPLLLTSCTNYTTEKHNIQIYENLVSTFTTEILTNDDDRYNNIKVVSEKLNNYVLKNGEEFSFNEVCGPYGEDEGFKEAPILLSDGSHDEGIGGGVCQLSSTLYNAVKDLDIEITERHHHSAPVGYVPENDDATISLSNNLDFKFINNTGFDLKFTTSSTEDWLRVNVYKIEKTAI